MPLKPTTGYWNNASPTYPPPTHSSPLLGPSAFVTAATRTRAPRSSVRSPWTEWPHIVGVAKEIRDHHLPRTVGLIGRATDLGGAVQRIPAGGQPPVGQRRHTDRPNPRDDLLIKTVHMFAGYYTRPEVTAEVVDGDGRYRTGAVVVEVIA